MAIRIKKLSVSEKRSCEDIINRAKEDLSNALETVIPIINDVKKSGDKALFDFTKKFDSVELESFEIDFRKEELSIPKEWIVAFSEAKDNITEFHKAQLRKKIELDIGGNRLGIKYTPVESVAVYAPGGKALYPSSILMGAIPAKIAGVKTVNLFTPPSKDGKLPKALVHAARISGIDRIYTLGGAQAVAAAAFGTETIEKSEFIVGPGNRYVAAAKSYLSGLGKIGIESPAGPSEVLIIADKTANPKWVACDMLSQAEHGDDSVAILATDSESLAKDVSIELELAMTERPKRLSIKKKAIDENSCILIFPDINECIEFSNLYAPEHLEIITENYRDDFEKILHAGSVFLGPYSPVAMGDYITGTNHILPTAGGSRIYSSLGTDTFLKRVTFQEVSRKSINSMYPFVKTLSEIEGLDEEHGTSVKVRCDENNSK
ncbi:MAG: histidinol dehydrogenase [Leptospira sp.]|nr:histidinol dehydrogenase [Leptospira sp.]